jgi:hypothetical protein
MLAVNTFSVQSKKLPSKKAVRWDLPKLRLAMSMIGQEQNIAYLFMHFLLRDSPGCSPDPCFDKSNDSEGSSDDCH